MPYIKVGKENSSDIEIFIKTGAKDSRLCSPTVAAKRGRLGRPNAVLRPAGLSSNRARPPRSWALQPDVGWERDGHLCRRSRSAGWNILILKDAIHVGHSTGGGEVLATSAVTERNASPRLFSLALCRRSC